MPESIPGVIHGRTIELLTDPGFAEGQAVQVVLRPALSLDEQREIILRTAGTLAHKPPEYFEDLDKLVNERQKWPDREISESIKS